MSRITLISAAGAAVIVAAISIAAGGWAYTALSITDPGAVVRILAPLLRFAVDASATVCVGALVLAAFFTRPQPSGVVSPAAFAALRTATRSAAVWSIAALLLWPLDLAQTVGLPLRQVANLHGMLAATGVLPGPKAWLITSATTAILAFACRRTLRWRATFALVAVAVFALLPTISAGHSASDTGHDLATAAIALHIPAAVIWLGTLIALVRARGMTADFAPALRRYGGLATGCWALVAFSGVADAIVLAPGGSAFTSAYGALLLTKVVLLGALGAVIFPVRRKGATTPTRLLVIELAALAATFALSVGLTDLPAPKFIGYAVSNDETLLGYNLTGPPTFLRLATDWRVEVLFAPLCLVLAWLYLRGVRRFSGSWPVGRTVAWLSGCVVLLIATSSGLGRYAPAMFSLEALTHMLIGMLVPLLLALGAPLTLIDAVSSPAEPDRLPGPREWIGALRTSWPVRALTQPLTVTVLFVGAPFLLYFTPIYDGAARFHWAHLAMDLVFLVIGYLFFWTAAGTDEAPRPAGSLVRVGLLVVAMPFEVVFAAAVLASKHIIGNGSLSANLYRALQLPWVPSLAADQHLGAYLALGSGEAIMLIALATVVLRWRPAEHDVDYEAALAELVRRRENPDDLPAAEAAARASAGPASAPETPQPQAVGDDQ